MAGGNLVYVVRHCQGQGQAPEAGLTAEGQQQAHALADFLVREAAAAGSPIERIVSSPLRESTAVHVTLQSSVSSGQAERQVERIWPT